MPWPADECGSVAPWRRYSRVEITRVQYVVELIDEGMTLAAIRRVLELEQRVARLEAERDALRAAVAERDTLRAAVAERDTLRAAVAERDAVLNRLVRGGT